MATDRELLADAIGVVNDAFLGMLTTVDEAGVPHARWMGAAAMGGGLSEIYTLCGRNTRKIQQIQANPNVCWVFSTEDYTDVVSLYGKAEVLTAPLIRQNVFDRLMDCARTWAMNALSADENIEFVTIKTTVERVELLSPRRKIFVPRSIRLGDAASRTA